MRNKLRTYIPTDHARQVQDKYYIEKLMKSANPPRRILDLGCGSGNSIDLFRKYGSEFDWKGLDISLSPEVSARTRTDCEFNTFDGVNIPFPDESFDLVYCHQVMEHVRYPEPLLKEVCRVLIPGGSFVGSTSYLEPYHSYSLRNYTPYGWVTLINDSGMQVVELRPGIDSIALINRQLSGEPKKYSQWFTNSPLNQEITEWGRTKNKSTAEVNYRKLHFCGQFAFYCRRICNESSATVEELKDCHKMKDETRNSVSLQLEQALIRPIHKPGRAAILLLYRLFKMSPDRLKRVILSVANRSKMLPILKSFTETATPSAVSLKRKTTGYRRSIRLAVYADANMNLIDGSSVWTSSLVEALAGLEYAEVFFFLKSKEKRALLTEPLKKLRNVTLISPDKNLMKDSLTPDMALDEIEDMDRQLNFNTVILRGLPLCERASLRTSLYGRLWTYLTDIPQRSEDLTDSALQMLNKIAKESKYILCQTEEFRSYWERYIASAQGKIRLLPPMVPACNRRGEAPTTIRRICYAGKFAPLWGIFEMFKVLASLREVHPEVELHIFGDKIHNPPDLPDFQSTVLSYLEDTAGVFWHRGLSREEVLSNMVSMDLGWAWRNPELENNTLELSTKILEYGRCGLPVILARNKVNKKLLGPDYPLFVDTYDDCTNLMHRLASSPDLLGEASAKTSSASEQFTVEKVRDKYIRPLFSDLLLPGVLSKPTKHDSILVTGHDLKFIDGLCRKFSEQGYVITVDNWEGHNRHDLGKSRKLIKEADIIISEWCLGNAVWYSKNKRPGQKHIIRFHLQERDLEYPKNVDMRNVDTMIFVGPHIRREAIARFGWERWADKKLVVIPNYVDTKALDLRKPTDAQFGIGIVGIVPQRKRLDLAVDIVQKLRQEDQRFHLYVKGKLATEYPWMLNKTEELQYYKEQMDRIRNSDLLKDAVHFDGWGDDMPQWYQKIGFILSVSDFESFHLSIPEGAASRAIPLSLKWEGAEEIYPEDWSYHRIDGMVNAILDIVQSGRFEEIAAARCAYVRQSFAIERIARLWLAVIEADQGST